MSNANNNLIIGTLLQNAGLVNQEQVEKALHFQSQFNKMKLEEILVVQNKIKSKTIDFFLYKWADIKQKGYQFPLGYYFQQASLLNNKQIQTILTEQKESSLKFGDIAIAKGWLNSKTVNFFLYNLSANPPQLVSLDLLEQYNQCQLHLERQYANPSVILTRIISWTGGNPALSKDICQFFVDSDLNISRGKEHQAVDRLIESALIKNWSTSKLGNSIRSIVKSLDNNQSSSSLKLWQEYREVLLSENREYQKTEEQDELLSLGLITQEENKLRVANLIFNQIFNLDFVVEKINQKKVQEKQERVITNNKQYSSNTDLDRRSNLKPRELKVMTKTESAPEKKENNPTARKKILTMILGAALLIPLFLIANSYLSPTKKINQLASFPENKDNTLAKNQDGTLQQFCEDINISDSASRLNLIFKLEQKKKGLLKDNSNDVSAFPDICEAALNEMRMLSIPDLGKENKTLEAIRILCKVPADSEFFTEAHVWLDRWYHSPNWGRETKFYLQKAPNCPAGKDLVENSNHEDH